MAQFCAAATGPPDRSAWCIIPPPLTRSGVKFQSRLTVDEAGKERYGLHALRHAAASLFIEQGWTAKRVQTVMGHASTAMTFDLYGGLFKNPEDDRKAMEQVQAHLLG